MSLRNAFECQYPDALTPPGFTKPLAIFYSIAAELGAPVSRTIPRGQDISLDPAQQRSFWILWNWWTRFRQEWEVPGDAPSTDLPRHAAENRFYELKRPASYSEYFYAALVLFEGEFFDIDSPFEQKVLHERRVDAALHSACFHTALACENLSDVPPSSGNSNVSVPQRRLHSQDLPGLHPSCFTGSSISSCSWIKDSSALPFYLWDVELRCTVEVSSLNSHPSYTAISHTWGRWRTGDSVQLPGIAWDIPQNSLFDVATLPDILARIPTSTPYVWFDLVCIPQKTSSRANEEIAKQAAIFRNATHTIIWFNRITDWAGLQLAVRWMSRMYLGRDRGDQPTIPDASTGFFQAYHFDVSASTDDMEAEGWYSSLWTLQEICLRPDMWLCNATWELFTVGGAGVPAAFNTIVALVGECRQIADQMAALRSGDMRQQLDLSASFLGREDRLKSLVAAGIYHRGFIELLELFDRTGMRDLHIIKKEYILLLGSRRYCESRRAEAIMSVLDAKRWRSLPDPGGLVLGQYELEFVREVARSMGASFFGSLSSRAMEHGARLDEALLPQGSLMPFEGPAGQPIESKTILNWEFGEEIDNPSVRTWRIQQDGSVEMPEAAILTSTPDASEGGGLISSIWLTYNDSGHHFLGTDLEWREGRRHQSAELQEWCRTWHPSSANFAVELGRVLGASRGILLKETKPGSSVMYKVGNYITSIHRFYGRKVMQTASTPSQKVDWTVL
ncbi:hypothetical protein SLS57_012098 [Botryosphaeria dothidea]